jgi:hypothetical protein
MIGYQESLEIWPKETIGYPLETRQEIMGHYESLETRSKEIIGYQDSHTNLVCVDCRKPRSYRNWTGGRLPKTNILHNRGRGPLLELNVPRNWIEGNFQRSSLTAIKPESYLFYNNRIRISEEVSAERDIEGRALTFIQNISPAWNCPVAANLFTEHSTTFCWWDAVLKGPSPRKGGFAGCWPWRD